MRKRIPGHGRSGNFSATGLRPAQRPESTLAVIEIIHAARVFG